MPRKKISNEYQVKHFNATVLLWLAFAIVLELCIILGIRTYQETKSIPYVPPTVLSFEDCAAVGYPVMETYPRQCRTADGRLFAEEIKSNNTYVNASEDDIIVTLPFSGAVTGKEFSIIGKARGTWFFEGSAPYKVLDKDGKVLDTGIIKAGEDWMTESFVPFDATVEVPESYICLLYTSPSNKA